MTPDPIEAVARVLYAQEKARSDHADAVLSAAKGRPITLHMEPWDECKDTFLGDARAALAAMPKIEAEVTWEVWEDDLMVANSTDEANARHYFAVYSQDGPVRLVRCETVRTEIITPGPNTTGGAT